ncbi:MAG TPA: glycosyl hydrolase family 8 [Mycobacteriales bacterium]|jgi:endoglucanase|nr:glycosyl hydrolase family 8 [Mycobacteriales bacterium]
MGRLRPGAATAVVALVATLGLAGCGTSHPAAQAQGALLDARGFFHDYVTPDGAVVRRDQGGDVVSEGQGYAMLLAFALDDPHRFAKVWAWTRTNLQRPDGLFAYHWQDGAVVDSTPAADADTQIAWALSLAGRAWSLPDDTAAARRIAEAIAESEIGYDARGRPTLAAGPWAVERGQPVQVEPGYWTFPAYAALATVTGDHRWQALTAADAAHLSAVSGQGSALPPDWATVGGGAEPASPPQTGTAPASGQDGLRAIVWAACLPATHDLTTRWWHTLAPTARVGPLTRSLEGAPISDGPSPLSLVAAAAAADVAGEAKAAGSLLTLARRTAAEHSTYYGDAWAALGQLLLSGRLPGCSP